MNFRNKDLTQVFEERYQANHNKRLNEEIKNNKENLANRMFGKNTRKIDNTKKVIGYNNFNGNKKV